MSCINLYRIDNGKRAALLRDLNMKMTRINTARKCLKSSNEIQKSFILTLYVSCPDTQKNISWNWILEEFGGEDIKVISSPSAVLLIDSGDGTSYAITFGHAFFTVDKYCDTDFGFSFARKISFKEIKTTTLTTPSSHRNKTVSTFVNHSELEFDSGESFAKLKAKTDVADDFLLYRPSIEVGNSIKFIVPEDSCDHILNLISYIEQTILNCPELHKIPFFTKIKDEETIYRLNERLQATVVNNPSQINISELDIIGATEVFNKNDSEFEFRYGRKSKKVSTLSNEELQIFCYENNLEYSKVVLEIKVISFYNGTPVVTNSIKDLIDYTDDEEKAQLSNGIWYKYNIDYLDYLDASIAEIPAEYHPEYDFNPRIHQEFIERKFDSEKNEKEYIGKTRSEIMTSLNTKYYAERAFNLLREEQDFFQNFDRCCARIGNSEVEAMDLYKDGKMFTVKFGNTSSKLCYAIDQSLESLKLYKRGAFEKMPPVNTAILWLVLERKTHIEDDSGFPDLNQLNLLMLKNRLSQWKKEVRLMGFNPIVYINYRQK